MGAQLSKGGAAEAESAAAKTNGQVRAGAMWACGATLHPTAHLTPHLQALALDFSLVCVCVLAVFWWRVTMIPSVYCA